MKSDMTGLTFTLVGVCVGEALCLSGFTSYKTPEVGAHLVLAPFLDCVTLSTLLNENLLSFFRVAHNHQLERQARKREKSQVITMLCNDTQEGQGAALLNNIACFHLSSAAS